MLNLDKNTKIILVIVFLTGINHSDSLNTLTRQRRQLDEQCFKCRMSDECISEENVCDGTVDCRDGSDENDCSKIQCPPFTFQCKYGACIERSLICDGKLDCRDGSDETTPDCLTTKCLGEQCQKPPINKRQINGSCVLPEHPSRGKWTLLGAQQLAPGDRVKQGAIITVKCNKDYVYRGNPVFCLEDGTWSDHIGVCEMLCPPLSNTKSTTVICKKNHILVDCNQPEEGTEAEFSCKPFYETRETTLTRRVCHEGSWDRPSHMCQPICGLNPNRVETLIGTINTNQINYPWHVGLYLTTKNPPQFLCSGTLISQNIVITAAHCVTNFETGALLSKDRFVIAVGKYYRDYNDSRDIGVQYSHLKSMYLMPSWHGQSLLYQADIAILITENVFKLTRNVQPICIDYDNTVITSILNNSNVFGTITGWGEVLNELKLPYIPRDKCLEQLPIDSQLYLTPDKFCTGYPNKDETVCMKNSGEGLMFRNTKNGRYYLGGVVSIAPTSENSGCGQIFYTNITQYMKNIVEKTIEHNNIA